MTNHENTFEACNEEGRFTTKDYNTQEDNKLEYNLKPFDVVLVRDSERAKWRVAAFRRKENSVDYPYICDDNDPYKYCIPYNKKTQHLLATAAGWEN